MPGIYNKMRRFCIGLGLTFFIICVTTSLVMRIYVQGYYCVAHVATITTVSIARFTMSTFVQSKCERDQIESSTSVILKTVPHIIYSLCYAVTCGAYAYLSWLSLHLNQDYLGASIIAGVACVVLLFLSLVNLDGIGRKGDLNGIKKPHISGPQRCCAVVRYVLTALFHIIFAFFVGLTVFYPCSVISDTVNYREDQNMYPINITNHRPLSLFIKCRGNGTETVMFEGGLGGTTYMYWHFIPRFLSNKYKVCISDRRGYGWSETLEHDYIDALKKDPQRAENNVEYLHELFKVAGVHKPFYYLGHSYGGHHIAMMALKYPETIKGLVFLDSSRFSSVMELMNAMPVFANFNPSGIIRFIFNTGIISYDEMFGSILEYSALPDDQKRRLAAVMTSGHFFAAAIRESSSLISSNRSRNELEHRLSKQVLHVPVQVIDSGTSNDTDWFPSRYFSRYDTKWHHVVEGSDHMSLVSSEQYAFITSNLITDFIESQK